MRGGRRLEPELMIVILSQQIPTLIWIKSEKNLFYLGPTKNNEAFSLNQAFLCPVRAVLQFFRFLSVSDQGKPGVQSMDLQMSECRIIITSLPLATKCSPV